MKLLICCSSNYNLTNLGSKSFATYEVRQSRFGANKGESDTENVNSIYGNDAINLNSNVTPSPVPLPSSLTGAGGLGGFGGLGGGGLTRGNALSLGRYQN